MSDSTQYLNLAVCKYHRNTFKTKYMKHLNSVLLLAALFITTQQLAQDTWSLEKCVRHALDASIDVNRSEIGIEQAKINLSQAKQSRLPSLNANTGVNWNFGRTVDPTTNLFVQETFFSNTYGISSGVSLFEGFQISNSIKQSKLDLESARLDTDQARQNVALTVATNYLNVLFAIENIAISERQLELSQQQLDQTNKLIEAGSSPAAERLNLEAQIAQSEQALIVSRNNLDISMLQLKQVLRIDPSYPLEVVAPDGIEVTTDPEMVDFEEAYAEARKNRPDLQSLEYQIMSADLGTKIARGQFYPSIRVGGSLGSNYSNQARTFINERPAVFEDEIVISSNDPDLPFPLDDVNAIIKTEGTTADIVKPSYDTQLDNNLSYGFGLSVGIPIYNNGSTHASVQRAKLNTLNAQLNYDQSVENLKILVGQSLADARAAKKKLEASNKTLSAQQLAFENTNKRLNIGAANSFEWENQKTQLENAELQKLIDKYDYLFKIKILEFYLGKPMKL